MYNFSFLVLGIIFYFLKGFFGGSKRKSLDGLPQR